MDGPLQSPGVNVTDALWDDLDRRSEQKTDKVHKTALDCPVRNLKKFSWRLFKEMTRSLSKRVQAVLRNDASRNKP